MKNDDQNTTAVSTQADDIFFNAIGLEDEDQRKSFVLEACGGDDNLRREVDSRFLLLTQVGNFLEDDSALWITARDLYDVLTNLTEEDRTT